MASIRNGVAVSIGVARKLARMHRIIDDADLRGALWEPVHPHDRAEALRSLARSNELVPVGGRPGLYRSRAYAT
ncbi:MAG: hypothetical protein J0I48_06780 [Devosia sp.]|uniref:hypothetical protein n=1 Tax=Devosia sp. 66-22 TaxID=1895753 RepID=UPI000925DCD1|nr:hypothetical protein [Devosia sp. 66-22]MBN9345897.1 hypothetical protein [Devosia sp.]OJX49713.1 MAG: hypothetical protein BGO81_19285 [Devosia sp. 66-22]